MDNNKQPQTEEEKLKLKEQADLKTAATKAALQLTQMGYKCKRDLNHGTWTIINPVGQKYQDKVPDSGIPEILAKIQIGNGNYDIPDGEQEAPGETIPEPEAPDIPVQADGSVKADDVPLFKRNPELKKALSNCIEPVTVDKEGNVHVGGTEIVDNGDSEQADEALAFLEKNLQECVDDENWEALKYIFEQMKKKGYAFKAVKVDPEQSDED